MLTSRKIAMTACLMTAWCVATSSSARAGYETNKFDLKARVESGGWVVAWSEDVTETDALKGIVAAGISVFTGNPAPFYAWCDRLVDRTISSLGKNAASKFPAAVKTEMKKAVREVFMAAVKGKNAKEVLRRYGTVDFKAGGIRYFGRNYITVLGKKVTLSNTWGLKLYVAFRIR